MNEMTREPGPTATAAEQLDRVRAVLTEWGVLADDGDFVNDDDFAEAVADSGAWRLARDLRRAVCAHPSWEEEGDESAPSGVWVCTACGQPSDNPKETR